MTEDEDEYEPCSVCDSTEDEIRDYTDLNGEVTRVCPGCYAYNEMIEAEIMQPDFDEYAKELCKLTGQLAVYDPAGHYAPSPEEYEAGDREAYTENSVRAFNRHNRTNYDELIKPFSKHDTDPETRAYYSAIRTRIEELLDEAEVRQYYADRTRIEELLDEAGG